MYDIIIDQLHATAGRLRAQNANEIIGRLQFAAYRDLRWRGPRERFSTRLYWETQIQRAEHLLAYFEYRQAIQRQGRTACSQ